MAAGRLRRAVSEADYIVSLDGERIGVRDAEWFEETSVALAELNGVMIETNDSGPFGADVWWLLFGADDRIVVAFPQGASGVKVAIDWLIGLPGFDHEAMIMAMGSTGQVVFPVWRRAFTGRTSRSSGPQSIRLSPPICRCVADDAVASVFLGSVEALIGQERSGRRDR